MNKNRRKELQNIDETMVDPVLDRLKKLYEDINKESKRAGKKVDAIIGEVQAAGGSIMYIYNNL